MPTPSTTEGLTGKGVVVVVGDGVFPGTHVTAACDIAAGELIMLEPPLQAIHSGDDRTISSSPSLMLETDELLLTNALLAAGRRTSWAADYVTADIGSDSATIPPQVVECLSKTHSCTFSNVHWWGEGAPVFSRGCYFPPLFMAKDSF